MKRLALGVSDSGSRQVVEWDDRESVPKQFYRDGRVFDVVMTMSTEHIALVSGWKSAAQFN
jgi:hypothetical protein